MSVLSPSESTEGDVEMSDGDRKCSADASPIQTKPKRRATLEYKKKDSNKSKVLGNVYRIGYYVNDTEGDNIEFSSPYVFNHGSGRPAEMPKLHTTVRVKRRCQELKVMVKSANIV
jgi:hypothetical protein